MNVCIQQYKSICAVIWIDEDMKNLESTLLPTKRPNLFYLINIFFQSSYLYLQSIVMFVACGGQTSLKIKEKKGISYLTHGHLEGRRLGLAKKFKMPIFRRYFKILSRGSRTSLFFSFSNISTNMVARGIQSFGQNGL